MSLVVRLAGLAEELGGTASRLKKRAAIVAALDEVRAESGAREAGVFALWLAGMAFAEADGRKLNVGGALLSKILLEMTGVSDAQLGVVYRKHGDMGGAAGELMLGRAPAVATLMLTEVEEAFAGAAVARTTAVRAHFISSVMKRATALEVKYLVKLMLGDMRIGVKQSLVEEAIAVASGSEVVAVRNAVMLQADLVEATVMAFEGRLGEARMKLFHPLGFMLASPVVSPEEAVARFVKQGIGDRGEGIGKTRSKPKAGSSAALRNDKQKEQVNDEQERGVDEESAELSDDAIVEAHIAALMEDKFDGMRAQVHCGDAAAPGRVAIYSRNKEDVTASFPEIEEAFAHVREPLILDGEILAWDVKEARALPFAVLSQRIGRKRVSNEMRVSTPVVFMGFDVLFAGGELLLEKTLRERRNVLEAVAERVLDVVRSPMVVDGRERDAQAALFEGARVEAGVPRMILSDVRLVESADDIDRAYAEARARGNEGVMLKAAESIYQPGRRGLAWVKLKRELATLDVVVTGAEFGHGRRAGILSDYTFAVRDAAGDLKNVGKAYSGLTDVEIAEMSTWMMAHTLEDYGHFRTVEPLRVLEVAFNNVMRSDRHASGFALRFPRIITVRDDKPVGEIDTVARVEEVFESQPDKAA